MKMVYGLSIRKLKKEAERLEDIAREKLIYDRNKDEFVLNFADSLYHRTCVLAKKIGTPPEGPHINLAEGYYTYAKNSISNDNKSTAMYDFFVAISELEKAATIYLHKKQKKEETKEDGKFKIRKQTIL